MAAPQYTSVAPRYDDMYRFMYETFAELIVQHLQLEPGDHLADVGGGTGAVSHLMWKKVGECSEIILWWLGLYNSLPEF